MVEDDDDDDYDDDGDEYEETRIIIKKEGKAYDFYGMDGGEGVLATKKLGIGSFRMDFN